MRIAALVVVVLVSAAGLSAQSPKWQPGRTPDGQPDIQGTWINFDATPFEAPVPVAAPAGPAGPNVNPAPEFADHTHQVSKARKAMVIEPADGRMPAMTDAGRNRLRALRAGTFAGGAFNAGAQFKGPEDLSLWERCITRGVPSAIFPTVYNANTRIVQAPGVVAITYEMIHDTRLVYTDGRTHVGSSIRGYHGDSRGHWEGDTLVVDVTNFSPKSDYRGSGETLHLVERFTRTANGLRYEVSVDDPQTWAGRWTAALDMTAQPEAMFEYACHEGNNSMRNILSGARAAER